MNIKPNYHIRVFSVDFGYIHHCIYCHYIQGIYFSLLFVFIYIHHYYSHLFTSMHAMGLFLYYSHLFSLYPWHLFTIIIHIYFYSSLLYLFIYLFLFIYSLLNSTRKPSGFWNTCQQHSHLSYLEMDESVTLVRVLM